MLLATVVGAVLGFRKQSPGWLVAGPLLLVSGLALGRLIQVAVNVSLRFVSPSNVGRYDYVGLLQVASIVGLCAAWFFLTKSMRSTANRRGLI